MFSSVVSFDVPCFAFFFVLSLVPLAPEPADFVWPAAVRGPVLSSAGALSNLRVSWLVRGDAVVDRLHIRDPTLGAAIIGRLRTLVRLTIVEIFRLPHDDFDEYSRRLLSGLEAVLLLLYSFAFFRFSDLVTTTTTFHGFSFFKF